MRFRDKLIEITPFVCLFSYLLIGFVWKIWSPTWVIFFLIGIVPILVKTSPLKTIYPLLCVAAYLVMGFVWGWWHPGWLVFLTLPIYWILVEPNKWPRRKVKINEQ